MATVLIFVKDDKPIEYSFIYKSEDYIPDFNPELEDLNIIDSGELFVLNTFSKVLSLDIEAFIEKIIIS